MVVQFLTPSIVPDNSWDRPPQPAVARRIVEAKRRRAKVIDTARRILARRTLGGDERIVERLRRLHQLYGLYRAAGAEILELELLD
jgi:hypothetical protein